MYLRNMMASKKFVLTKVLTKVDIKRDNLKKTIKTLIQKRHPKKWFAFFK